MAAMLRLLHTADWHVGMPTDRVTSIAAGKLRQARLDAIARLLEIANDRQVDAILCAGDQFDDNQVSPSLVEQVAALLNDRTRIPTFLIPGNHDPADRGSVYRRDVWKQLRPHVRVLTARDPVPINDDATLYPCPLDRRKGMDDPTASIARASAAGHHVALAHGTMKVRDDVNKDDFPISLDAATRASLDYVAMGHWHSTLPSPCGRCWYSGTHEGSKFGDRDAGNALLVTIPSPGAMPQVESIGVGTLNWCDEEADLDTEPIESLAKKLRDREDADRCLLRLRLRGAGTSEVMAALDDLAVMLGERFVHHEIDDRDLRPAAGDDLLGDLDGSPYLVQTANELRDRMTRLAAIDPDARDAAVARRALQILQQAAWQVRSRG